MTPEHTVSCWEAEPLSPAETTILKHFLEDLSLVRGKRMLHVGIGNSEFPYALRDAVGSYVGITISQPELDRFVRDLSGAEHMQGLLMNKYDARQHEQLSGEFDLIVDTLLKSVTCCEKHFQEMMQFFASKLSADGKIITTRNGINFGWRGPRGRAYTPGAQSEPEVKASRVLGEDGLLQLSKALGLIVEGGPVGETGDVILVLRRA